MRIAAVSAVAFLTKVERTIIRVIATSPTFGWVGTFSSAKRPSSCRVWQVQRQTTESEGNSRFAARSERLLVMGGDGRTQRRSTGAQEDKCPGLTCSFFYPSKRFAALEMGPGLTPELSSDLRSTSAASNRAKGTLPPLSPKAAADTSMSPTADLEHLSIRLFTPEAKPPRLAIRLTKSKQTTQVTVPHSSAQVTVQGATISNPRSSSRQAQDGSKTVVSKSQVPDCELGDGQPTLVQPKPTQGRKGKVKGTPLVRDSVENAALLVAVPAQNASQSRSRQPMSDPVTAASDALADVQTKIPATQVAQPKRQRKKVDDTVAHGLYRLQSPTTAPAVQSKRQRTKVTALTSSTAADGLVELHAKPEAPLKSVKAKFKPVKASRQRKIATDSLSSAIADDGLPKLQPDPPVKPPLAKRQRMKGTGMIISAAVAGSADLQPQAPAASVTTKTPAISIPTKMPRKKARDPCSSTETVADLQLEVLVTPAAPARPKRQRKKATDLANGGAAGDGDPSEEAVANAMPHKSSRITKKSVRQQVQAQALQSIFSSTVLLHDLYPHSTESVAAPAAAEAVARPAFIDSEILIGSETLSKPGDNSEKLSKLSKGLSTAGADAVAQAVENLAAKGIVHTLGAEQNDDESNLAAFAAAAAASATTASTTAGDAPAGAEVVTSATVAPSVALAGDGTAAASTSKITIRTGDGTAATTAMHLTVPEAGTAGGITVSGQAPPCTLSQLPTLGYACLNMALREYGVYCSRDCNKKTFDMKGLPHVSRLALANARDITPLIEWNERHHIRLFRLSSCIFPWMSFYDMENLPDWEQIKKALWNAGEAARKYGHRLTFHPSEFVKLAGENPAVVQQSVKELEVHSKMFDYMGFLPATHYNKINIHVGGGYGDKDAAIDRFVKVFKSLSPNLRARMTVENDDRPSLYSVKDLMELHKITGIPIVFDFHHHKFCSGGLSQREAFLLALSTWPAGVRPIVHWSESQSGRRPHAHSDYVGRLGRMNLHGKEDEVDVMIESKAKEVALLRYREAVIKGVHFTQVPVPAFAAVDTLTDQGENETESDDCEDEECEPDNE